MPHGPQIWGGMSVIASKVTPCSAYVTEWVTRWRRGRLQHCLLWLTHHSLVHCISYCNMNHSATFTLVSQWLPSELLKCCVGLLVTCMSLLAASRTFTLHSRCQRSLHAVTDISTIHAVIVSKLISGQFVRSWSSVVVWWFQIRLWR